MSSFPSPFATNVQQEPSFEEELCGACPKLTYEQRVYGFISCCGFGYLLSFLGTMVLFSPAPRDEKIRNFAALYIIGNAIALSATLFLIGPRRQCQKMFDKTRRISTIVWLCTLVLTFVLAVAGVDAGLVMLMLLVQISASIWYSASYIPYGRRMIIKIFQSTCFQPCPKACDPCIKIAT